ncbi:lytic transglycosylase domain-containing protein [Kingella potus]|nr:lytic transglycosylase domain-containing protein [Kingella potus]
MNKLRPALAVLLLAACTAEQTVEPANSGTPRPADTSHFRLPNLRGSENPAQTLDDYNRYESTLQAAKAGDDIQPAQFLATQSDSAMGEAVRNEWLKSLAKRGIWQTFQSEYARLAPEGRSKEVRCYAELAGDSGLAAELVRDTARLPAGCNTLLETRAAHGRLNPADAWRRVRGLIAANQTTDAARLAAALGSPLDSSSGQGAQENQLRGIIGAAALKNPDAAAARLAALENILTPAQTGFAWGVLGRQQAKNQNFAAALDYYARADRKQLTSDQIEWYARSALRRQDWPLLASVIRSMPEALQQNPAWIYWLGRSHAALGDQGLAAQHYRQAAASGRNFYAVLAAEELGGRPDTRSTAAEPAATDLRTLERDGAVARSLTLFRASGGSRTMRRAAQAEWRYATRGFNDDTLIAASRLAHDNRFYEMAVHSADNTTQKHNFHLRYISPYRESVTAQSAANGIDPAWVFGLIRQESRFVTGAQSGVGAQGLMQVMPATAREIARKTGMDNSELYTDDGNIRMGTWYLADARRRLQNSEVLAAAGYNAGPGRARQWQAAVPLEAAIYAETIPFDETRDYVKKVMVNTAYYSALFGSYTPLKQRMGTVPAK